MAINYTQWHEYPSNFSGGQNVSGFGSFFQYLNDTMSGSLGAIILFLIFIISFILQGGSAEKRGSVSLFITAFLATILMRIEIISYPIVIILWIATIIVVLVVRKSSNEGRL